MMEKSCDERSVSLERKLGGLEAEAFSFSKVGVVECGFDQDMVDGLALENLEKMQDFKSMEDNVMMKGGEDQIGSLFMAKSGGGSLKESDLENPADLDHDEVRDSELVADCKEDSETFTSIMGDIIFLINLMDLTGKQK
jgi:hypothetical protein